MAWRLFRPKNISVECFCGSWYSRVLSHEQKLSQSWWHQSKVLRTEEEPSDPRHPACPFPAPQARPGHPSFTHIAMETISRYLFQSSWEVRCSPSQPPPRWLSQDGATCPEHPDTCTLPRQERAKPPGRGVCPHVASGDQRASSPFSLSS